ncbi:MAG TPA: MarR family transcriptional regulator [Bradyrhizobium sp.]|uniref:MarR family winged helix-turn-helix transcriptional regulator n=1 Tax=Bradyrhizobium sp. TaxID=376 RepID=UPI002C15A65A|nr:MarR family transcriptional regulator [Bradyrhizobium sp.]HLZ06768.1 MarR family transcriptional regulator [Bradyrhizobium sp.]
MLQSRLVKKTAAKDRARIVQFAWTIVSMNAYFEKIHQFWAKALGITAPQWSIIVVLAALDEGEGVPVNVVSKKAQVHPSFVTTQSQALEKQGFVRRKASSKDARIVLLSLTDKSYKQLAELASRRQDLDAFIFQDLDEAALLGLVQTLEGLDDRFAKGVLKLKLDL